MSRQAESDEPNTKNNKELKPLPETEKKLQPISKQGFHNLLKRAITPPVSKPHPKST